MSATGIDFILAVMAGILGGVVVGKAMKEHSLGILVDAIADGAGAVSAACFYAIRFFRL